VKRPRLRSVLAWAAALLVLLLAVGRGVELARVGWQPSARGEARWFGWAWGSAEERALVPDPFHASARDLPPGGPLVFETTGSVRPGWLHVMAQYALPGRVVAEVLSAGAAGDRPSGAARPAEAPVVPLAASDGLFASARPRPARRLRELGALAAGGATALATGLLLLGAAPRPRSWPAELPLALPLGLALAVPCIAASYLLGGPAAAGGLAALLGAAGLRRLASSSTGASAARRGATPPNPERPTGPPAATQVGTAVASGTPRRRDPLRLLLLAVLALLLALFLARTAQAPIWSWDHFAQWGMKARRIHAVGLGAHTFAGPPEAFVYANGHYPLGLPLAWLDLAAGARPAGWLFRAAQALFGVALALLVRRAARALGASPAVATLAACLVAASPLLWDTENLGLAELPLALWSIAAVAAALDGRRRAATSQGWIAGLLVGFLPWIKAEGWLLAVLLGVVLGWAGGRRAARPAPWRGAFAGAAVLLSLASTAVSRAVPAPGVSFFTGDPVGRALDRFVQAAEILRALAADLLAPEWLGAWLLVAAGLALAARRRRWLPALLGAVVLMQLAAYAATYFATYLDPLAHVESSFFRISAGLLPLALVAASGGVDSGK